MRDSIGGVPFSHRTVGTTFFCESPAFAVLFDGWFCSMVNCAFFRQKRASVGRWYNTTTNPLRSDSTAKTCENFVGLFEFTAEVHLFTTPVPFALSHLFSIRICPEPIRPKVAFSPGASPYIFAAISDALETMFTDRFEWWQCFLEFHKKSFKERAGCPIGKARLKMCNVYE